MCISPEWEHAAIARGGRVTRFSLSHWLALSPPPVPEQAGGVRGIELVNELELEAGLAGDARDAEKGGDEEPGASASRANAKRNANANTNTKERPDLELSEPVLAVDLPKLEPDGDGSVSLRCNRL